MPKLGSKQKQDPDYNPLNRRQSKQQSTYPGKENAIRLTIEIKKKEDVQIKSTELLNFIKKVMVVRAHGIITNKG